MKKNFLIVNNQCLSAALWEILSDKRKKPSELADLLKVHKSTVQYLLSGKTRLEVNRLYAVCGFLEVTEQQVFDLRDVMVRQVKKELGNCKLLSSFPSSIKNSDVILRTLQLNARRTDGVSWIELINPDGFSSDDFMRARSTLGWSRDKTAEAFGVSHGTICHWEKISFPKQHEKTARKMFSAVLRSDNNVVPLKYA